MLNARQMGRHAIFGPALQFALVPVILIGGAITGLLLFSTDAPSDSFWHRSDFFWIRFAWATILALLIPTQALLSHRQQIGGGYPAIKAFINFGIAASLGLLLISMFFPQSRLIMNLTAILQTAIMIVCLGGIAWVKHAQAMHNDGIVPIPAGLETPEQLCTRLTICEREGELAPELVRKLKSMRERIKYSVPQAGKVASSVHYRNVVQIVGDVCGNLSLGNRDEAHRDLDLLDNSLTLLISECKN